MLIQPTDTEKALLKTNGWFWIFNKYGPVARLESDPGGYEIWFDSGGLKDEIEWMLSTKENSPNETVPERLMMFYEELSKLNEAAQKIFQTK